VLASLSGVREGKALDKFRRQGAVEEVTVVVVRVVTHQLRGRDDIAGTGNGAGQTGVVFAQPLPRRPGVAFIFGKENIEDDAPCPGGRQKIDDIGMQRAWPRPAPHARIHHPQGRFIDKDDGNLRRRRCLRPRQTHAQIKTLPFQLIEPPGRCQPEGDRRRGCADEQGSSDLLPEEGEFIGHRY